jgi:putative transcriptional regulator
VVTPTSLAGQLLIAMPALADPNFVQTVILIIEHTDQGTFGLVLNRPSDTTVDEALPVWEEVVTSPPTFFVGGPVEPDGVLGLVLLDADVDDWIGPTVGRIGLLDVSRDAAEVAPDVSDVRLFAGHSGWGAGQLEMELAVGSWFVVEAAPDDAFSTDPESLWRRVLARQGGVYSTVTPDPSTN